MAQQQQKKQVQDIIKYAPAETAPGVKKTLASLIRRLKAVGDNDSIAKMKIETNEFAVRTQAIRNYIAKDIMRKGVERDSENFHKIVDRLSTNIMFHIIRNENYLEQQIQMQGQAAEDLAYYKEYIKEQQAIRRMKNVGQVFYGPAPGAAVAVGAAAAPATGPAPAPTLDQKEKKRIMDEIKACLKKYGVGVGGGGGGP